MVRSGIFPIFAAIILIFLDGGQATNIMYRAMRSPAWPFSGSLVAGICNGVVAPLASQRPSGSCMGA